MVIKISKFRKFTKVKSVRFNITSGTSGLLLKTKNDTFILRLTMTSSHDMLDTHTGSKPAIPALKEDNMNKKDLLSAYVNGATKGSGSNLIIVGELLHGHSIPVT